MAYNKYRRSRRSNNSLGSTVGDVGFIANKFGPKGALIAGVIGFAFFYWVMPAFLQSLLEQGQSNMTGSTGAVMAKFLDGFFIRRFIHPSQWAGIAILVLCVGIAVWKAFTRTDIDCYQQHDASFLAKLIARFLD